jgi:hypothetical protein
LFMASASLLVFLTSAYSTRSRLISILFCFCVLSSYTKNI